MKHRPRQRRCILSRSLITLFAGYILAQCGSALAQESAADHPWYEQWGEAAFFGSNVALLDVRKSGGWIEGLSVTGFLQNTTGMWVNSDGLTDFGRAAGEHHGANSLSVERNLLQLDVNYLLNGDNKFFLRFWGVYEPPYPWEAGTIAGPTLLYDRSQSDFYNRYDVRDAFWTTTNGPLTLFLGRQTVTWGESIAFRVGDVVNPQDLSWNFGFANLEQSRLPLWMVHPILSLPRMGPFGSNFIEGIWTAPWQPAYTSVNYADQRYQGQYDVAGAVNLLPPGGGRFDTNPYPFTTSAQAPPGVQAAFPQIKGPASPSQSYRLPADTWASSTEGFRLHTLVENAEITMLYWHSHQLNPTPFVVGTAQSGQSLQFRYPELNDIGVTMNRPVYFEGEFLSSIPIVIRTEAVWQDRTPFNTVNTARSSAVIYSSTMNTLLALDLDNLDAPWLTATGTLTANLEWNNYTILSPNKDMVYSGYAERWRHNEENLLFSANTSWWWGAVAPTAVGIYNPDGNTWEFFPNIVFTPPWTNKYFMNLQYIGILGNDKYSAYAGGVFKGKSIFLMQFQYNFNLIQGKS